MGNPVGFEVIIADYVAQDARGNARERQKQPVIGPLARLRAALATLITQRTSKPAPAPRPLGETAATTAL